MKKVLLAALSVSAIINSASAQLYLRAGAGFATPQAGQTLDGSGIPYSGSLNSSTYEADYTMKNVSFSSGTQGVLGLGYMFTDHVGVQLDASVGLSNTSYSSTQDNVNLGGGYSATETITMKARSPLLLMPSLVLQTGSSAPWNIYGRFGAAVPLISSVTQNQSFYISSIDVTVDYTSKLTSSFSLGISAAAGVQYKLSDKATLWGEVNMLSMSLFLKHSEYTRVTQDGVSYPLDSIGGAHPVNYSRNAKVDTNYNTAPTYSLPFSNVGMHVGITFQLSEKKRHKGEMVEDKKNFKRRRY